jgi:hypothetical protein
MDNTWLNSHANNIKSQHGEDGTIKKIFEIIPDCNNMVCRIWRLGRTID